MLNVQVNSESSHTLWTILDFTLMKIYFLFLSHRRKNMALGAKWHIEYYSKLSLLRNKKESYDNSDSICCWLMHLNMETQQTGGLWLWVSVGLQCNPCWINRTSMKGLISLSFLKSKISANSKLHPVRYETIKITSQHCPHDVFLLPIMMSERVQS